ncbi:MAG: type I-F CRISPR-associated protein Csy3 [Deltaproteobacteria bacterium]|nr:type I-F CRISPR-associated protein Csy3 [Deltaproteobacteria bacterium]
MSKTKQVDLPSVLSFERKLETSDAIMYAGNWGETDEPMDQEWQHIQITKRQNRSTQSAFGIDDEKKIMPNPVSSDSDDANLPHNTDTLKVSFSIRIIGNVGKPFACNDPGFAIAIDERMNTYKKDAKGLKALALRYAYNFANGRFLWRNRVCAEKAVIKVKTNSSEGVLTFKPHDFSLNDFKKGENDVDLQKLATVISSGLNGNENTFSFIEVDAYVKLGSGQHVFPSQEMNMNEKKKVLFRLPVRLPGDGDGKECAAIHNVKIGNAIRTIDNWYKDAEFPIAVEPYGSVTQMGQAYRKNEKEGDFYSLMINWLNEEEKVTADEKIFVVANLIRGGVFGKKAD